MDCLWNVCGLLGMDFSVSLIGFPQPLVCVGRSRRPWPPESYWLLLIAYIVGILSGIFLALCVTYCKGRNATMQLQEIRILPNWLSMRRLERPLLWPLLDRSITAVVAVRSGNLHLWSWFGAQYVSTSKLNDQICFWVWLHKFDRGCEKTSYV